MIDLKFKDNILRTSDTLIYKARNILSTQIGSLAYATEFGIDYDLFFGEDYTIQNQTFQAYAISKLSENGINPLDVLDTKGTFDEVLNIQIEN